MGGRMGSAGRGTSKPFVCAVFLLLASFASVTDSVPALAQTPSSDVAIDGSYAELDAEATANGVWDDPAPLTAEDFSEFANTIAASAGGAEGEAKQTTSVNGASGEFVSLDSSGQLFTQATDPDGAVGEALSGLTVKLDVKNAVHLVIRGTMNLGIDTVHPTQDVAVARFVLRVDRVSGSDPFKFEKEINEEQGPGVVVEEEEFNELVPLYPGRYTLALRAYSESDLNPGTSASALASWSLNVSQTGECPVTGVSPDDVLIGTPEDDQLTGTAGLDVVLGLGGNDRMDGLGSDDLICGGPGNDVINGDDGRDVLLGGDGEDILIGGLDADNISGGFGDDRLVGGRGADLLRGDDGNDELGGFGGDDQLFGGEGADTMFGDEDADRIYGGAGQDTARGGSGDDIIDGGQGADHLFGGEGDDDLDAYEEGLETEENSLYGGAGDDNLIGSNGDDALLAGDGTDTLRGLNGNDAMNAGGGYRDVSEGDQGDDVLVGDGILQKFAGGDDDDVVMACDGNLVSVDGGPGTDSAKIDAISRLLSSNVESYPDCPII